eukprot:3417446-Rhodomonas_salina.1
MSGCVSTAAYIRLPINCWYLRVSLAFGTAGHIDFRRRVPGSEGVGTGCVLVMLKRSKRVLM